MITLITATFSELLVLGCVTEVIKDPKGDNNWHHLDLRDEKSGDQLYVSITDPGAKRLSPDEAKAAASLLDQAQGLSMGDRVSIVARIEPSLTPTGAQKLKPSLVSISEQPAQLQDKVAKAA